MIRYEYAHDENEKLIHISSIDKVNRWEHKYHCLLCHEEMRPRLGNKRSHHYYHLNRPCSYESYIHKLGKEVFHREYQKCVEERIPFYVDIPQKTICSRSDLCPFKIENCVIPESVKQIDLTKYYPLISMPETSDGKFIPDLYVENDKGDKIYIEICYTSECSEKKRASGIKIIEIKVGCQSKDSNINNDPNNQSTEPTAEDFTEIVGHHLGYNTVRYYNFKDKEIKASEQECGRKVKALLLYKSRKIHIETYPVPEYLDRKVSEKEVYCEAVLEEHKTNRSLNDNAFAAICLAGAYREGYDVSHCKLCKNCLKTYCSTQDCYQYHCTAYARTSFDEKMYIYLKCQEFDPDEKKIYKFLNMRLQFQLIQNASIYQIIH